MKTARRSIVSLAVLTLGIGASSACRIAPDDGGSEEQEAQDRAWGYARDGHAAAHFLVQHGAGSLNESNTYYGSIIERFVPSTLTLDVWQAQFLVGPTVNSYYRNTNELGFWRDMTCTKIIRRGSGGCMVTNYKNETDKAQHRPNLGTVAMTVSPEGFSRFYVFLPNGVLSPTALLDDEGPKFAPRLCTVCHGGSNPSPGTNPDLGSIFREFEPSLLQAQTGLSRPDAEAQLFALNQAVRTANQSIRSEAEGSPAGVDHAKATMSAHLDELYPDLAPPARPLTDPALVPVSWQTDPTNTKLWTTVVAPYCMACHRHNADDWAPYGNFEYLQDPRAGAVLLREYISGTGSAHPYPFMPQSELMYTRLAADSAAQGAIDAWACSGGTCNTPPTPSCNPSVLFLADAVATDPDVQNVTQAISRAGLRPTVIPHGTTTFDGGALSSTFGAILVSPGRVSLVSDMLHAGQQAIVSANAEQGTGVVFTEQTAYLISAREYADLHSISLLGLSETAHEPLTFTLTVASHPIWTGLPSSFSTARLNYTKGIPIHGGVQIASLPGTGGSTTAGVVARESQGTGGRIVHIADAANEDAGWEADTNLLLLLTNSLRWAAHCL